MKRKNEQKDIVRLRDIRIDRLIDEERERERERQPLKINRQYRERKTERENDMYGTTHFNDITSTPGDPFFCDVFALSFGFLELCLVLGGGAATEAKSKCKCSIDSPPTTAEDFLAEGRIREATVL